MGSSRFVPDPLVAFFLSIWALYVWGALPGLPVGDAGELVAAAHTVGIAHPPGYPLYTALLKVWMVGMPLGNLAFRGNIFSALAAAGTLTLLWAGWRRLVKVSGPMTPQVQIVGWIVGVWGAWRLVWWEAATTAEVYALLALLMVVLVWHRKNLSGPFWLGMGLAHHYLVVLLVPVVVWRWLRPTSASGPSALGPKGREDLGAGAASSAFDLKLISDPTTPRVVMAALMGVGLAAFLWLPLRAPAFPEVSWGLRGADAEVRPQGLTSFLAHVTRAQYGSLARQPRSLAHLMEQLRLYGHFLRKEMGTGGVALILAGLVAAAAASRLRRRWTLAALAEAVWGLGWLTVGLMVVLGYGTTPESLSIVEPFFIPSVLAGVSLVWLGGVVLLSKGPWGIIPHGRPWGMIGLAVVGGWMGWEAVTDSSVRRRTVAVGHALGLDVLDAVPRGGVLGLSGDNQSFSVLYHQAVEGRRLDVRCVESRGNIFPPLDRAALHRLVSDQTSTSGATGVASSASDHPATLRFAVWSGWGPRVEAEGGGSFPAGLVMSPVPISRGEGIRLWRRHRHHGLDTIDPVSSLGLRMVGLQYHYLEGERRWQGGSGEQARRAWGRALGLGFDLERFHYNLGRFYEKIGRVEDAVMQYHRAVWVNPSYSLPCNNLGVHALNGGRMKEAVGWFVRAVEADPGNIEARSNWGSALARSGRLEEAIRIWREAWALAPGHPLLEKNLRQAGFTP